MRPPSTLSLLDLPPELIAAIAEQAHISDALRLRLACRRLALACDFLIKDRRHRLYLHPGSVQHAIDLCAHPKWTQSITEVLVLGCSEPSMRTREPSHSPDHRLDHHPWDQFPPTQGLSQPSTYQHLIDAEFNSFEQNYAPLLEGLLRLPNVHTLVYLGRATAPGFCAVSDRSVEQRAKSRDFWQSSFGGDDQPKMQWALRTVWWSDAHVFKSILSCLSSRIRAIEIRQPMAAVRNYRPRDIRGAHVLRQEALFDAPMCQFVARAKLVAPGQEGWCMFLANITSKMPFLKDLEIDIASRIDEQRSMQWRRQINPIDANDLWEEDWDLGDRFTFAGMADTTKCLQRFVVRSLGRWPYSNDLTLSQQTILRFLRQHKVSLRHVELHNMIFYVPAAPSGLQPGEDILQYQHDLHKGMQIVLQCMTAEMSLDSAVLSVARLGCVEECQALHSAGGHNDFCESYAVGSSWYHVRSFESLAERLDIEEENGAWNFAARPYRLPLIREAVIPLPLG